MVAKMPWPAPAELLALHLAYASCGVDENGIGIVPAITLHQQQMD